VRLDHANNGKVGTAVAGLDAWHLTQKSASFENWRAIGQALTIGRDIAVRASGVTTGKHYAKGFYAWANQYGFAGMHKSERWAAVDLAENIDAIEAWRSTLPEKERQRLINPLSNTRRWRASLTPKADPDALAKAKAAWRKFVALVELLPPDRAAPLWQAAQAQAAVALDA
jgi:hypothetical protein